MLSSKVIHCPKTEREYDKQTLAVAPETGTERLLLSFWRGTLHCSIIISKDEAREFADSILELIEESEEPNPNQQSIHFPQQQAA